MLSGATTEDRRTTVLTPVIRRLVLRSVVVYLAGQDFSPGSAAQAEALDQGPVTRDVDLCEVVQ